MKHLVAAGLRWSRSSLTRRAAWAVLAILAAVHLWFLPYSLHWYGDPPLFDLSQPADVMFINWFFVVLPWVIAPVPLIGVWLLFEAIRRGGGRWWWRWWFGALLTYGMVDWPIGQILIGLS